MNALAKSGALALGLGATLGLGAACSKPSATRPVPTQPSGPAEKLGPGYFVTEPPQGAACAVDAAGKSASPHVTEDFAGVPTSNKWWSSLMWKYDANNQHSLAMHAHPLVVRASSGGLGIGYPDQATVTQRTYLHEYREELLIGLEGLAAPETRVAGYSDWMVTADWDSRLRLSFGHGLPFVYGERLDAQPVTIGVGASSASKLEVFAQGRETLGLRVFGHHYGLFAPLGAEWERTPAGFRLSAVSGRYFSVALLPDGEAATLELFRRHAYAHVRSTRVSWQFDEPHAVVETSFAFESELVADCARPNACANLSAEPLFALYRHQWLAAPDLPYLGGTYASPRGAMKVLTGADFRTRSRWGGLLPILPAVPGHEEGRIRNHLDAVLAQPELFPKGLGEKPENDAYWEGKSFGKLSNLVHLSDQLGEIETRDALLAAIKARLEDWFDGQEPRLFYYDRKWRSLMGFPDSYGSATQINDHHFHYGYFVMAAATVARFDRAWAKTWAPFVEQLIHDAANWSREDESFPFLRYMDSYAGHSWANGPAQFEQGNNEESASEEINFSNACVLWGALTDNVAIRDLGAFLVSQQVSAVEQYWFDVDRQVFPKDFKQPVVAMVWGAGGKYDTWFDQDPTVIHGINFLPFTGASLYLGRRPDFVNRSFDVLLERSHGEITTWRDYILMFLATADAERARELFDEDPHFEPEFGNSMAFTLHWLEAWQELGRMAPQVSADSATAVAFDKSGHRSYGAFNPSQVARDVTFSDGKVVHVPAGKVVRE